MPHVKPFCALRYDFSKIKRQAAVLAPPYDVISPSQVNTLYRLHPFNVIRLILGKEKKTDTLAENKYTRAGRLLADWTRRGILKKEAIPSVYVYAQDFREGVKTVRRLGFIAAMKINLKKVLKHENTLQGPKIDRMALLKEVRANLSPIFGLFEDPEGGIQGTLKKSLSSKPVVDVTIDGVRHRFFVESRPQTLRELVRKIEPSPMFIADGHHRFEVACQYKELMLARHKRVGGPGRRVKNREAAWHYVMTYFSDCRHNPFTIFPTHRILCAPKGMNVLQALEDRGRLEKEKNLPSLLRRLAKNRRDTPGQKYTFGVYTKKNGFYFLTLKRTLAPKPKNNAAERLDVSALHRAVIEPCFKIHALEKSPDIDFTQDAAQAKKKVDRGVFDLAFFLRPTSLDEMIEVSKKGLKMPQKSTYFYPKLLSGLAFHSLHD